MEINYKCIWKLPIIFTLHQTCLSPQHSVLQNLHQWSPPVHHSLHVSISVTSPGLDYNRLLITPLQSTVGKLMFKWTIILQYWQFQEGQKKVFCGINLVNWHFLIKDISIKSQSILKIRDISKIYLSWGFWNTLYMFNLSVYLIRIFRLKYNPIFAPNFCQRWSCSVPNMTSSDHPKVSFLSLMTPLKSYIARSNIHSFILDWQGLLSCPTWNCQYCTYTISWDAATSTKTCIDSNHFKIQDYILS